MNDTEQPKTFDETDIDEGVRIIVPITLRQLEAAGSTFEGGFGCDAAEHDELLDDASIVRVVVDVAVGIGDADGQVYANEEWDAECFQGTLANPDARWMSCVGPRPDGSARTMRKWQQSHDLVGNAAQDAHPSLWDRIIAIQRELRQAIPQMAEDWSLTICPHCDAYTDDSSPLCAHCEEPINETDEDDD